MTVSQLIQALANYAPGADVRFEYCDFEFGYSSDYVTDIKKEGDDVVLYFTDAVQEKKRDEQESQP